MDDKLRIEYNIAAAGTMIEGNKQSSGNDKGRTLLLGHLILVRDRPPKKFTMDGNYFVVSQNEWDAEVSNNKGELENVHLDNIWPVEDWVIRKPVEAWFLIHNFEPELRKTLFANIITNMLSKSTDKKTESRTLSQQMRTTL